MVCFDVGFAVGYESGTDATEDLQDDKETADLSFQDGRSIAQLRVCAQI